MSATLGLDFEDRIGAVGVRALNNYVVERMVGYALLKSDRVYRGAR